LTYNACATVKWNGGSSFPIQTGHGCIGCSEPGFWDRGGLYQPLSTPTLALGPTAGGAAVAGVALGALGAALARSRRHRRNGAAEATKGGDDGTA
ncbi:MAG: uptake hydrogenase small subunit, partial [Burkholderiales bacterium]|nr:uptake hydrogenase small subunit [Burkholderiales bacterium]